MRSHGRIRNQHLLKTESSRYESSRVACFGVDVEYVWCAVLETAEMAGAYGFDLPPFQHEAGFVAVFDKVIVGCLAVFDNAHESMLL